MDITTRYRALLHKLEERKEEVLRFVAFLESKTNWLSAPASTKYHLNRQGGLLEHSVNVTECLLKMKECLKNDIPQETCILVGLFHDIGKVGLAGKPYYIPNDNQYEIKKGILYKINPELTTMGIATRSLFIVAQHICLCAEEAQAIAYHDGLFVPEGESIKHRETPLTLLLHWADYWVVQTVEKAI
ncbi:MAG: HD domain-containing protein [Candidatus Omnitrophota bacterium]